MARIEPFEKYTKQYEDWFIKNRFIYESELKAIREQLPESKRGVEIGVGTGQFGAPLGIKVGIEPSRKMGEIARKRGIWVIEAIAENLPLKGSVFDFALMVTAVCFLDDIKAAFKEIYRILREKGAFLIGFIDRDSPLGKLYQRRKEKSVFYNVATFYSVEEIFFHLKQAGFKGFNLSQTIFSDLKEIKKVERIKEGYGEGSFVVVKAIK
ncbi:MAG: class I SAM-dependent methyltransferase [bacterium]